MTIDHQSSHARGKILLLIPGRVSLTILLQFEVHLAVVSMIDISTALVDLWICDALEIYMYMIQEQIYGIKSMSTQLQVVK